MEHEVTQTLQSKVKKKKLKSSSQCVQANKANCKLFNKEKTSKSKNYSKVIDTNPKTNLKSSSSKTNVTHLEHDIQKSEDSDESSLKTRSNEELEKCNSNKVHKEMSISIGQSSANIQFTSEQLNCAKGSENNNKEGIKRIELCILNTHRG